ncbi:MerR family DNA-binding transcriptional regulator [Sphingomonas sp. ABOLD]|uniref:DNA-binding transcriptional MerR regulator n=1 Tax=Sphingomonas trueperi TaxID=53317 RepID=A0A7X5XXW7_9SPHN|nr:MULTISPECIES: MerR family DNA-binding transcriptional regulator [Sphingomonas]NJB97374.1 DNA-binding transcriptional MerR regulator [Sphingomonas trueperi]RSV35367.1 MerR family DNA-binding transcriptional regulator [Sphingomonas sp. ABOLE]RSV41851.1 MerR family DNA-binding transcriptional regulator [Sphingomonas sp. ABOLD]
MTAAAAPIEALAPIEPRPDRDAFSISDLCAEFGVTPRALRFYEDEGLIAPERRGTQRIYTHRDRARLAWILRGKRVGFSLGEIKEMIDLYDLGDGRRVQRQVTLERCMDRIRHLEAQKRDIDAHIAELAQFVDLIRSKDNEH